MEQVDYDAYDKLHPDGETARNFFKQVTELKAEGIKESDLIHAVTAVLALSDSLYVGAPGLGLSINPSINGFTQLYLRNDTTNLVTSTLSNHFDIDPYFEIVGNFIQNNCLPEPEILDFLGLNKIIGVHDESILNHKNVEIRKHIIPGRLAQMHYSGGVPSKLRTLVPSENNQESINSKMNEHNLQKFAGLSNALYGRIEDKGEQGMQFCGGFSIALDMLTTMFMLNPNNEEIFEFPRIKDNQVIRFAQLLGISETDAWLKIGNFYIPEKTQVKLNNNAIYLNNEPVIYSDWLAVEIVRSCILTPNALKNFVKGQMPPLAFAHFELKNQTEG